MDRKGPHRSYGAFDNNNDKSRSIRYPALISKHSESTLLRNELPASPQPRDITGSALLPVIETRSGGDAVTRPFISRLCAMGVVAAIATVPVGIYRLTPPREEQTDFVMESDTIYESYTRSVTRSVPSTAARPLAFTAVNFYHLRDGKPAKDYPWLKDVKLIEPHRETTLTVTDPREGFDYRWEVGGPDMAGVHHVAARGARCVVSFTQLDENIIVLEEISADGEEVVRRLEEAVMVKYVRREIRTLTDDEREELLDAMFTLWETRSGKDTGRELYGEDYTDVWNIASLHFSAASQTECDHFHDGLGFLTSHSQLSNSFEYSLQLVNPKLTLPYWDFTIETSERFRSRDGVNDVEPQRQSPLLQPSWFGGSDSEDNQVKDGRWRYTGVPTMAAGSPSDTFQRLRAPWNFNKRPYLTRGLGEICGMRTEPAYPWPTCKTHYDLLTRHGDFYGWGWDAQYDPHGTVHIWMGGVVDCEGSYARISSLVGEDIGMKLATLSFIHRKNLYRDGIFVCRVTEEGAGNDDDGTDQAVQTCGCLDYELESGEDFQRVLDTMIIARRLLESFDASTTREVVSIICNAPIAEGDHLQASSPVDPTFWPMHPTMERLWMFKRLTGTMTDLSWPDEDTTSATADGIERPMRLSLYSNGSSRCVGHGGSDIFPFGLLDDANGLTIRSGISTGGYGGDGSGSSGGAEGSRNLRNREVLQALDPRANNVPYVYDTFRWDHCEAEGIDFDDTWDAAAAASAAVSDGDTDSKVDYSLGHLPLAFRKVAA